MALGHDKGALCGIAGLGCRRAAGMASGSKRRRFLSDRRARAAALPFAVNEMCDCSSLLVFVLIIRY